MMVTIDSAGRLVIPKPIREEAGIEPGAPLRISVRDGRIEIEPGYVKIRLVKRHGITVAERVEPGPTLTNAQVRRTLKAVRERPGR